MSAGVKCPRSAALMGVLVAAWAILIQAQPPRDLPPPNRAAATVIRWDNAALQGIRDAKRPASERTLANKQQAISYAASVALCADGNLVGLDYSTSVGSLNSTVNLMLP